jgi:dipeptidyl-peptidase 4
MSLLQRYQRAASFTAPKLAAQTCGLAVEGYWLDAQRYFFLAERFEATIGRIVEIPSIVNAATLDMEAVILPETLIRLLSEQGSPVDLKSLSTAYFDMPDPHTLAVSVAGHDYLFDPREPGTIAASPSFDTSALYSPDGRHACFVRDFDLWLLNRRTREVGPLTTNGLEHYGYGQQPQTGLSAISYRRRPRPVGLWSPDSQWFLTHRIDERELPVWALLECSLSARPHSHSYRYATPTDSLASASYVAINVASRRCVEFADLPIPIATYSPFLMRTVWFGDANIAWTLRFDRYFKQVDLIRLDLALATSRVVLSERASAGYLDLHPRILGTPNVRTLVNSPEVIWFSERDGWGHLYLYDASTGALKHQITAGEWWVTDLVHVDETKRRVFFLAGGRDSAVDRARRTLCVIGLDGSGFEVLRSGDGDVFVPPTEPTGLGQDRPFRPSYASAGISPGSRFGVVRIANAMSGNETEIAELAAERGKKIASARPISADFRLRHFSARAADGLTALNGVLFLPPGFNGAQRYPLVDYIYPGPHTAHQPQSFCMVHAAPAMALAELGFITVMVDTRGTPFGNRAFRQAGYPQLLEPQLADHAAVVRQLCKELPFIDIERIGVLGHSAGGAAAVRAICEYGEVFRVAAAVCGVYNPSLYASLLSDKYRGPEGRNANDAEAITALVGKLAGKLLLVSGDMDENVHPTQTLAVVDALIRADRNFDLLVIPGAGHGVLLDNGYAQRHVWDYFAAHLLAENPPRNFNLTFEPHELLRLERNAWRESRQ